MSAPAIRRASLTDLPALAVLFDAYRQFYAQAPDLPRAHAFLAERLTKHEAILFLAENADGAALGFCQLYPSWCSVLAGPIYVLYDLYVGKDARQHGVGRALLEAAAAHARAEGVARLDLSTAKTNLPAQALYASQGWQRDDIFYTYHLDITP